MINAIKQECISHETVFKYEAETIVVKFRKSLSFTTLEGNVSFLLEFILKCRSDTPALRSFSQLEYEILPIGFAKIFPEPIKLTHQQLEDYLQKIDDLPVNSSSTHSFIFDKLPEFGNLLFRLANFVMAKLEYMYRCVYSKDRRPLDPNSAQEFGPFKNSHDFFVPEIKTYPSLQKLKLIKLKITTDNLLKLCCKLQQKQLGPFFHKFKGMFLADSYDNPISSGKKFLFPLHYDYRQDEITDTRIILK